MSRIVWINHSGQQLTWYVAMGNSEPTQTGPLDVGSHVMPTPPGAASAGIVGATPAQGYAGAYINPGEFGYDCVFFVFDQPLEDHAAVRGKIAEVLPQD